MSKQTIAVFFRGSQLVTDRAIEICGRRGNHLGWCTQHVDEELGEDSSDRSTYVRTDWFEEALYKNGYSDPLPTWPFETEDEAKQAFITEAITILAFAGYDVVDSHSVLDVPEEHAPVINYVFDNSFNSMQPGETRKVEVKNVVHEDSGVITMLLVPAKKRLNCIIGTTRLDENTFNIVVHCENEIYGKDQIVNHLGLVYRDPTSRSKCCWVANTSRYLRVLASANGVHVMPDKHQACPSQDAAMDVIRDVAAATLLRAGYKVR